MDLMSALMPILRGFNLSGQASIDDGQGTHLGVDLGGNVGTLADYAGRVAGALGQDTLTLGAPGRTSLLGLK